MGFPIAEMNPAYLLVGRIRNNQAGDGSSILVGS